MSEAHEGRISRKALQAAAMAGEDHPRRIRHGAGGRSLHAAVQSGVYRDRQEKRKVRTGRGAGIEHAY